MWKRTKLNVNTRGKYLTLDWDDITYAEAERRIDYIFDNYSNVRKLVLSQSPLSGYHVRLYLYGDTNIALMRRAFKDDGRRLVHDLLNRPYYIHDILWSRKTVQGIPWESIELKTRTRKE